MTPFTAGQLDTMMDAASVWFFGITALLLIMMTVKYARTLPGKAAGPGRVRFNEELDRMIRRPAPADPAVRTPHVRADSRYRSVVSMAGSGLSAIEISRRIDMPRSEVELILRLNRFGAKSRSHGPDLRK